MFGTMFLTWGVGAAFSVLSTLAEWAAIADSWTGGTSAIVAINTSADLGTSAEAFITGKITLATLRAFNFIKYTIGIGDTTARMTQIAKLSVDVEQSWEKLQVAATAFKELSSLQKTFSLVLNVVKMTAQGNWFSKLGSFGPFNVGSFIGGPITWITMAADPSMKDKLPGMTQTFKTIFKNINKDLSDGTVNGRVETLLFNFMDIGLDTYLPYYVGKATQDTAYKKARAFGLKLYSTSRKLMNYQIKQAKAG